MDQAILSEEQVPAEVEISDVTIDQDPPSKKLWSFLSSKEAGELYTNSYSDFVKKYSTPESIQLLHATLSSPEAGELYTNDLASFEDKYFPELKKKGGTPPSSGGSAGASAVTTPTTDNTQIIQVPLDKEGVAPVVTAEPEPTDAISKVLKSVNLGKATRKQEVEVEDPMLGTTKTLIDVPDEQSAAESKRITEELKAQNINADDLYEKIKDLPEDIYNIKVQKDNGEVYNKYSKENLSKMYQESPVSFDYAVNNLKNRFALKKAASEMSAKGEEVNPVELSNKYNDLNQATSWDQWKNNKVEQQNLINTYLPNMDDRKAALKRLEDNSSMYLNPNNEFLQQEYAASPLKDKLDLAQYSALTNMQLFHPEKYESTIKMLTAAPEKKYEATGGLAWTGNGFEMQPAGEKETQESIDQKIGKQSILQDLSSQGRYSAIIGLQDANEKLAQKAKDLPEDQKQPLIDQYNTNIAKIQAIKADFKNDDKKYPELADLKYDTQVKDLMQQAGFNAAEYGVSRLGKGINATGNTLENVIVSLFGSDADKTAHALAKKGEQQREASEFYLPSNLQGITKMVDIKATPQLQAKLDAIVKGRDLKDLSADEVDQMKNILAKNQNQLQTITPIDAGKSKNFLSLATLYSNTGMLGDIASFAVQGGALGALGASDVIAATLPMWTTTQDEKYKEGLAEGMSDSEANGYANLNASIMALAGLISPKMDVVKRAIGIETKAGQAIAGISEKTWNSVVEKNKPLIDKITNSLSHTAKEAANMGLTYGVGTSVASDVANKAFYNKDVTGGQIVDNAITGLKNILTSSAGLLGIGAISNFKSTPLIQKSALWDLGNNPELNIKRIDEAVANNQITAKQGEQRKAIVNQVSGIIEKMPTNDKYGKRLTDIQRLNNFYNLLLQNKIKEESPILPKAQKKELAYTDMVLDHANNLIIDPKTPDELAARKAELEAMLEPQVESDGIELILTEEDENNIRAEIEAIDDYNKKYNPTGETKTSEELLSGQPSVQGVEQTEVVRQMKPITDKMVEIEREFGNNGFQIDTDYDNEIQVLDKDGEQVDPEDLPDNLKKLAADYETATRKLGEFDDRSREQALKESRGVVETEAEVVEPTQKQIEGQQEGEITPMEVEEEQPPFVQGGTEVVTHSGLTEPQRQKLIEQRNKELKITDRAKEQQSIIEDIEKYNALPRGRLGKQKSEGLNLINKIRLKINSFNEKYGANNYFNEKRGELIGDNKRVVKKFSIENRDQEIDTSGTTIRNRDQKTQEIFDTFLENGSMPTGYTGNGMRMSDVQLDATIQDILDGVPSRRANKYLNDLEAMIREDDFDFTRPDSPPREMTPQITFDDVVGIQKEIVTEPMTDEDIDRWLNEDVDRTPENEEVYDNIDNLISQYETENESKGEIPTAETGTTTEGKGEAGKAEPITTEQKPTGTEVTTETKVTEITPEVKTKLQAAKEAAAFAKARLEAMRRNLGIARDTQKEAQALYDYHKAIVKVAKEYIAAGIDKIEDFAKEIGEKVNVALRTAWDEATGKINPITSPSEIKYTAKELGEPEEAVTNHPYLYRGSKEKRVSGLMSHIQDSKNVSEATKQGFKEEGIKYEVANNAEARKVATDIIKAFGKDDALQIARGTDMHPSVRSAIYGESINDAFEREQNAKTDAEKIAAAEEWKDLVNEYDEKLTEGGQFTAYAGHFYKVSPLGFVMREKEANDARFNEWYDPKSKTYDELWNELTGSEEGRAKINEELEKIRKEERKQERSKRDKNIDDFFDSAKMKGGTYLTIIPPMVWNAAMDVLKLAVKGGDRVVDAVQKAIDHITDKIGDNWDKEKFRKEYEDKLNSVTGTSEKREANYEGILNRRRAELERRIREGDYSAEEYKDKRTLTDKEQAAKDEYERVKKLYDEEKKKSKEYQDKKAKQFLDKFADRMKGLTDEQKQEVVRRSIKKLVETGGLEKDEFKKIIADVIGIKDLTDEQVKKIEDLTNTANAVVGAEDKMVADPTPENIKAYLKAKQDGMQASLDLYNMLHRKADIVGTIKSLITGNLLSVPTLIKNIMQNVIMQSQIRFPKSIIKQVIDLGTYGASVIGNKLGLSKVYEPTTNIIDAQRGYFSKGKKGIAQGWFNFKRGTEEKDYFGKTSYRSSLAPKEALKDLKLWKKGEKFLTTEEVIDRKIRASIFSRQADFILRGMGFGDRPQRWAAEGSTAAQIAKNEFKLSDLDEIEAFSLSPQKYTYKLLIGKGVPHAEATERANEVQKRIEDEGSKAVLEEENVLSKISKHIDVGLQTKKEDLLATKALKTTGAIGKTLTYPFVKIPANVYWQMFKLMNPELSLAQSVLHGIQAAKFAKEGKNAKAREYYEKSKDSFAMTILGYGFGLAATTLVSQGFVRSSNEQDQKKRETEGERVFGKQNELNLGRLMGGGDYWVNLDWFGPMGAELNTKARIHDSRKQAELAGKPEDLKWYSDLVDNFSESATQALNQLVFDQGARTIDAMKNGQGAVKLWTMNTMNTLSNIITGGTYAAMSKAMLPVEPRLKGDTWTEEIINNQKQRNVLVRLFAGQPPSRISIWGDPIKKDNSITGVMGNMLGFEKDSKDQFGSIIYADFVKTQNPKFFPVMEDTKITVDSKPVEISQKERDDLNTFIGQARKNLVAPFVYDMAKLQEDKITYPTIDLEKGIVEKKYSDLNDENKVKALNIIYEQGRELGYKKFVEKYPKYAAAQMTEEKAIKEAINKKEKEVFKKQLEVKQMTEQNK